MRSDSRHLPRARPLVDADVPHRLPFGLPEVRALGIDQLGSGTPCQRLEVQPACGAATGEKDRIGSERLQQRPCLGRVRNHEGPAAAHRYERQHLVDVAYAQPLHADLERRLEALVVEEPQQLGADRVAYKYAAQRPAGRGRHQLDVAAQVPGARPVVDVEVPEPEKPHIRAQKALPRPLGRVILRAVGRQPRPGKLEHHVGLGTPRRVREAYLDVVLRPLVAARVVGVQRDRVLDERPEVRQAGVPAPHLHGLLGIGQQDERGNPEQHAVGAQGHAADTRDGQLQLQLARVAALEDAAVCHRLCVPEEQALDTERRLSSTGQAARQVGRHRPLARAAPERPPARLYGVEEVHALGVIEGRHAQHCRLDVAELDSLDADDELGQVQCVARSVDHEVLGYRRSARIEVDGVRPAVPAAVVFVQVHHEHGAPLVRPRVLTRLVENVVDHAVTVGIDVEIDSHGGRIEGSERQLGVRVRPVA